MTTITVDQQQFFERQKIPLSKVLDAAGMTKSQYSKLMAELGYVVAIGVSPCNAFQHTVRTRAGHCAQCKPANLAFQWRFDNPGEVYVATSRSARVTKIGSAISAGERLRTLNSLGYGGVSDWTLEFQDSCERAGLVEFKAQTRIKEYRIERWYLRDGVRVNCQELFGCGTDVAVEAINSVLASIE